MEVSVIPRLLRFDGVRDQPQDSREQLVAKREDALRKIPGLGRQALAFVLQTG